MTFEGALDCRGSGSVRCAGVHGETRDSAIARVQALAFRAISGRREQAKALAELVAATLRAASGGPPLPRQRQNSGEILE